MNQTLMDGTGEQGDAVPADLVAEVLAGDADRPCAGWFEDIPLQVVQLPKGKGAAGDTGTAAGIAQRRIHLYYSR